MIAQDQIPRREHESMNPSPSPYVAESGQVGELGQPTSGAHSASGTNSAAESRMDAPARQGENYGTNSAAESRMNTPARQEENYSQDYSHAQAPPDRGLHFGGKDSGTSGDTEVVKPHDSHAQQHPLQATHDVNIGHGHEPLSSSAASAEPGYVASAAPVPGSHSPKRGVGSKVKEAFKSCTGHTHKEKPHSPRAGTVNQVPQMNPQTGSVDHQPGAHKSPGLVDKMKDAVTGQKPGQGTATGKATAGSGVPGEEDYTGGNAAKTPGEHEWPRPVPPPGMFKPNMSAAEHYSPNQPPQHSPNELRHSPVQPHQGETGLFPPKADTAPRYDTGNTYDSRPGESFPPKADHAPQYDTGHTHNGRPGESIPPKADHAPQYDTGNTYDNRPGDSHVGGTTYDSRPGDSHVGGTTYDSRPGESHTGGPIADHAPSNPTNLSSTPAEPNAKHETPSYQNTGSEYADPHGGVHQEGPRDDNVKKEGFMSKVMDKLHLGSPKKNTNTATNI